MNLTTTHLAHIDIIVSTGLIENKLRRLRVELLNQGLTTSEEIEALEDLQAKFLLADHELTS